MSTFSDLMWASSVWDTDNGLGLTIESIFADLPPSLGAFYYDPARSDRIFADTAGTVPALPLDPIALMRDNARATPADMSQATATRRPRRVGTPSQFGSELVLNGTFATDTQWTKGTGWTITGGVAAATAATGTLSQSTAAAIVGRQYQITYTIAGLTAGSITPSIGGVSGKTRTANGTYTDLIKATSTAPLSFATATTTATLDNVSAREVTAWGAPWWLEFDGTEDYLESPDGPASIEFATSSFTIGHRVSIQIGANASILGKRGSGAAGTNPGWGTRVDSTGKLVLEYDFTGNVSGPIYTATGQSVTSLTPATLIYTFNASSGTFTGRLNGVDMTPINITTGSIAGSRPMRIGASADASAIFPTNGLIGRSFGIGRLLTPSELATFETWLAAGG